MKTGWIEERNAGMMEINESISQIEFSAIILLFESSIF